MRAQTINARAYSRSLLSRGRLSPGASLRGPHPTPSSGGFSFARISRVSPRAAITALAAWRRIIIRMDKFPKRVWASASRIAQGFHRRKLIRDRLLRNLTVGWMLHGFVLRKFYIHPERENAGVAEKVSFANNLSKTRAQAAPFGFDRKERKRNYYSFGVILFRCFNMYGGTERRLKLTGTFADSERAETLTLWWHNDIVGWLKVIVCVCIAMWWETYCVSAYWHWHLASTR